VILHGRILRIECLFDFKMECNEFPAIIEGIFIVAKTVNSSFA